MIARAMPGGGCDSDISRYDSDISRLFDLGGCLADHTAQANGAECDLADDLTQIRDSDGSVTRMDP